MLTVLRQRDFALLWSARIISVLGDRLLITALPFYVYRMTGSALASGLILVAYTAPSVLLGAFGIRSAVVADALSFLVSGLLIVRIATAPVQSRTAGPDDASPARRWRAVWRDWLGGLRVVRDNRTLATVFLVMGVFWFSQGIFGVLIVPFAQHHLGMDAQRYGIFSAVQAVGGLAGGVLVGRLGRVLSPPHFLAIGLGVSALLLLALFAASSSPAAMIWGGLAGLPGVAIGVGAQTLLQASSPAAYRGRVFGAYGTTVSLLGLAGMAIAGVLASRAGMAPLLDAGAVLYLFAALSAVLSLARSPNAQTTERST